jgi:hypothetical protein
MATTKTYKDWMVAVRWRGLELEFVPAEFKTLEMCLTAVEAWGEALEFVPVEMRTLEMCKAAFGGCGEHPGLKLIPKEHWQDCMDHKDRLWDSMERLEGW